eukprot:PITA_11785
MSKCVVTEPSSFEEAVEDPAWVYAMVEEYDSIVRNSAWEIVPRPEGKSVVGSRWIYKVKQAADGSVEKYKARFVARGFSQIEGIDYEETFAPVARYSSIRTILAFSAQMGWHIHQLDVKIVFLPRGWRKEDATLAELVDPTGYQQLVESHVCRLKRGTSGYGLDERKRRRIDQPSLLPEQTVTTNVVWKEEFDSSDDLKKLSQYTGAYSATAMDKASEVGNLLKEKDQVITSLQTQLSEAQQKAEQLQQQLCTQQQLNNQLNKQLHEEKQRADSRAIRRQKELSEALEKLKAMNE